MTQPTPSDDISQVCILNSLGTDGGERGDVQDLRQLIQTLPTREDIQVMMGNWLGPLNKEIGEVREEIEVIDHKMHRFDELQEKIICG